MECATGERRAEAMKPGFNLGVLVVCDDQQPQVKKHLLRLGLGYTMPLVLADITGIPIESFNMLKINHGCIL